MVEARLQKQARDGRRVLGPWRPRLEINRCHILLAQVRHKASLESERAGTRKSHGKGCGYRESLTGAIDVISLPQ